MSNPALGCGARRSEWNSTKPRDERCGSIAIPGIPPQISGNRPGAGTHRWACDRSHSSMRSAGSCPSSGRRSRTAPDARCADPAARRRTSRWRRRRLLRPVAPYGSINVRRRRRVARISLSYSVSMIDCHGFRRLARQDRDSVRRTVHHVELMGELVEHQVPAAPRLADVLLDLRPIKPHGAVQGRVAEFLDLVFEHRLGAELDLLRRPDDRAMQDDRRDVIEMNSGMPSVISDASPATVTRIRSSTSRSLVPKNCFSATKILTASARSWRGCRLGTECRPGSAHGECRRGWHPTPTASARRRSCDGGDVSASGRSTRGHLDLM